VAASGICLIGGGDGRFDVATCPSSILRLHTKYIYVYMVYKTYIPTI